MNILRLRDLAGFAAISALAISIYACGGEEKTEGTDVAAKPAADSGVCVAPANWFPHDKTPKPSDSGAFTTNCEFQQWSWQSFLWLTQTMPNGMLRFESFATPADLAVDNATLPAFSARNAAPTLRLMPRTKKSDDPTTLDEINQAGSQGLLIDQNGRAVYYSMYINDVFYEFVRKNGLYDPATFASAPDTMDFPVGAMELKASWKVVGAGENTDGFYTRKATVNKLTTKNGKVVVDPTQTEDVTVALVGLHIAGVVEGHPEFIWATFEQKQNAPTMSADMLNQMLHLNSDSSIRAFNKMPVSDKDWTFYKANTPVGQANFDNAGLVKLTDPTAQTLTPITNVYIQYAQGGGTDENQRNINTMNESVLEQLNDPIWSNYYLGGAIWLKEPNALVPNSTQQDLITGSKALSNSTMETFTQKVLSQNNCFQCHNTMQRFPDNPAIKVPPLQGMNLSVSHILVNNYFQRSQMMMQKAETGK